MNKLLTVYMVISTIAFGVAVYDLQQQTKVSGHSGGDSTTNNEGDDDDTLSLMAITLIFANFFFVLLVGFGTVVRYLFLGALRVSESQHITREMIAFSVFQLVFISGAVQQSSYFTMTIWVVWTGALGLVKALTVLSHDRFDFVTLQRQLDPQHPPPLTTSYTSVLALILLMMASDLALVWWAWMWAEQSVLSAFFWLLSLQCLSLFVEGSHLTAKWAVLRREDNRPGALLFYIDFVSEMLVLSMTLVTYVMLLALHKFSFTMVDMFLLLHAQNAFGKMVKKVTAYRNYRQLVALLDTLFPLATQQDLDDHGNDVCPICQDPMQVTPPSGNASGSGATSGGEGRGVKLPCGHLFHRNCILRWLESQQRTCPTCRANLIPSITPTTMATPQQQHMQQDPPNLSPLVRHRYPQAHHSPQQPQQPQQAAAAATATGGWSMRFMMGGGGGVVDVGMVRAVKEVVPYVPDHVVAEDLVMTRSVELTVENALEGRLGYWPPPPPPPPLPEQQQPQQQQATAAPPATPSPAVKSNQSPTTSTPTTTAMNEMSGGGGGVATLVFKDQFHESPELRQTSLKSRKQALVEAAKKRFQQQSSPAVPSPSSTTTTTPPQPTTTEVQQEPLPSDDAVRRRLPFHAVEESSPQTTPSTSTEVVQTEEDTPEERRRKMLEALARRNLLPS